MFAQEELCGCGATKAFEQSSRDRGDRVELKDRTSL
jgi:hypothetical protein